VKSYYLKHDEIQFALIKLLLTTFCNLRACNTNGIKQQAYSSLKFLHTKKLRYTMKSISKHETMCDHGLNDKMLVAFRSALATD